MVCSKLAKISNRWQDNATIKTAAIFSLNPLVGVYTSIALSISFISLFISVVLHLLASVTATTFNTHFFSTFKQKSNLFHKTGKGKKGKWSMTAVPNLFPFAYPHTEKNKTRVPPSDISELFH